MNIDDVHKVPPFDPELFVHRIFQQQYEHALKYTEIEAKNGFWNPPHRAVSIDDTKFQHWTKDFLWRTTEELCEAIEELPPQGFGAWREQYGDDHKIRHTLEELADAVHFLAEVSVFHRLDPERVNSFWGQLEATPVRDDESDRTHNAEAVYAWTMRLVRAMGLAANCLKNKPWKLTQMPTDRDKFVNQLYTAWREFAALWRFFRCTREDVHNLYFKKTAVNKFRQETQY